MKLVEQSHEILTITPMPLQLIEAAGRTCYKSQDKITPDSAEDFSYKIVENGHHSVLEHAVMTIRFITNRGVTHELVRHRLASFSQESTRYVRYNGDMEFIKPVWWDKVGAFEMDSFCRFLDMAEHEYKFLLQSGWRPEQAREVLPNALKTEIVVTANMREWHHIFKLRTSKAAHPQIRALMLECLKDVRTRVPILFDDNVMDGA
jgi:thymidylate synthase (FAD)